MVYYTAMPSKRPPMSIRPSEGQLAAVLAYAKRRGVTVHAAVLELIDLGLAPQAAAKPPVNVRSAPKAAPGPKLSLPVGPARSEYGARLKKR